MTVLAGHCQRRLKLVGAVQRGLDRRPQGGRYRQPGLVREDPQRPPAVPGLGEPVQAALNGRREPPVSSMAVGNKPSAGWRIALVRMRCHQPTKDSVARRVTEGKTKTERSSSAVRKLGHAVIDGARDRLAKTSSANPSRHCQGNC
jgi:hypothetical protein